MLAVVFFLCTALLGAPVMACEPSMRVMGQGDSDYYSAYFVQLDLPGGLAREIERRKIRLFAAIENELEPEVTLAQAPAPQIRNHLRLRGRRGLDDPRPATMELARIRPVEGPCVTYRSGWYVLLADERASIHYRWPAGTTRADKARCTTCERPLWLKGKTEKDGVWEIWSGAPWLRLRLETGSGVNPFQGSRYERLGEAGNIWKRVANAVYVLRLEWTDIPEK